MMFSNGASRARANTILMWVTLVVIALVPLALGGNRPMSWTLTLFVLATAGLIYFRTMVSLKANMTIPLNELPVRVGLIGIFSGLLLSSAASDCRLASRPVRLFARWCAADICDYGFSA